MRQTRRLEAMTDAQLRATLLRYAAQHLDAAVRTRNCATKRWEVKYARSLVMAAPPKGDWGRGQLNQARSADAQIQATLARAKRISCKRKR
jgi:hypothetical protein